MSEEPRANPTDEERVKYLADLLVLDPHGVNDATGEELFLAPIAPQLQNRVYGGQVLAQAVMACSLTVTPARPIHSMHAYFLRPGDSKKPITFGVDRLRDGRSFSARRVNAYQNGKPILSMLASFQEPAPGLEHQISMPENIPGPEELESLPQQMGHISHPLAQEWAWKRPFDIRHVDPSIWLSPAKERKNTNMVWLRAPAPFDQDQPTQRAALAYASDYTVLEPILRHHGLHWIKPDMSVASLDHAMWWHRTPTVDEWMLYVSHSPASQGARGLGQGHFFSQSGELLATIGQEGMVRVPDSFLSKVKQLALEAVLKTAWRKPKKR